jgi:hypothetical protein
MHVEKCETDTRSGMSKNRKKSQSTMAAMMSPQLQLQLQRSASTTSAIQKSLLQCVRKVDHGVDNNNEIRDQQQASRRKEERKFFEFMKGESSKVRQACKRSRREQGEPSARFKWSTKETKRVSRVHERDLQSSTSSTIDSSVDDAIEDCSSTSTI